MEPHTDTVTCEPYSVLGLPRDASYHEVRRAYRRLALESHPDTNGPDGIDRFISVQSAYQAITREVQGAAYGPTGAAVVPWSATVPDAAVPTASSPPPPPPRVDLLDSRMAPPVADALRAYLRGQQLVWQVPALVSVLA